MRTISIFARAIFACGCMSTLALPCAADDAMPEANYWRQSAFSIPFKVADAQSPDERPTEVRLYVSPNSGSKWDLGQTVPPDSRSFTYRAPGDGEYWFQIRTVDRSGKVTPPVGGKPELRVIVDTVQPRLDLSASRGENGEIKANWFAADPALNPDTLKIDYLTSTNVWRPVAVDKSRPGTDRSTSRGTVTWWPADAPSGDLKIRAEISDRAGNAITAQAKADAFKPGQREDLVAKAVTPQPDTNGYPATQFDQANVQDVASAQRSAASSKKNTKNIAARGNPAPSQTEFGTSTASNANRGVQWPADNAASAPLGRNFIPNNDPSVAANGAQPAPQMSEWQNPPQSTEGFRPPVGGEFLSADSRGRETVSPPIRNQVLAGADPVLPAGERPRMVNSKSFEMDYEVDSVGPSGIAKVELWGTRDGGQTWRVFGVDNDNRSPIRVSTDGEGLYGFNMVVQSGNGLAGRPPRSGDKPEVWVGVDLTKPIVRINGIQIGEGPHAGELLIQWQASDKYLAARPITLLFSDKQSGPWSIIAAGLENNGQYAWRPDNRVPQRIFLRIEARDEAGNTATFDAPELVSLEQVQPEGKIRGVRSVNDPSMGQRTPTTTWR
jgi:hypothetical protein